MQKNADLIRNYNSFFRNMYPIFQGERILVTGSTVSGVDT